LVLPGMGEPIIGNETTGLIQSVIAGIRFSASDLEDRLFLRVPAALLRRKLEGLLDGQKAETIAFQRLIRRVALVPRSTACSTSCSPSLKTPIRY
jgi:hypothetical protein